LTEIPVAYSEKNYKFTNMNIKVTRDCGYDTVRRTMQHEAKDIMQNRQLEEAALPLRQ